MSKLTLKKISIRQEGVSLIETMAAILIFSVGILGIASMQSVGFKTTSNSNYMNIAVTEARNMADKMLANPQAVNDGYFNNISNLVGNVSCSSSCSTNQRAQLDIYDWQQSLASALPSSSGTIVSNGTTGLMTIVTTWGERGNDSSEDKIHALTFMPYQP